MKNVSLPCIRDCIYVDVDFDDDDDDRDDDDKEEVMSGHVFPELSHVRFISLLTACVSCRNSLPISAIPGCPKKDQNAYIF